jgi:hypothetical protein
MWCEVILCRQAGRRLKPSEWPAPIQGYLFVVDFSGNANSFQRHLRVARLKAKPPRFDTEVLKPLFSSELVRAEKGKVLLAGVELDSAEGGAAVFEHQQLWLCRPLGAGPGDSEAYEGYRAPSPPPAPRRPRLQTPQGPPR